MVPPPASGAAPGLKRCNGAHGCGQFKPLAEFKLRNLRCKTHRQDNQPGAGCQKCAELLTRPGNRQPRCKTCDVARKSPNRPPAPITATPLPVSAPTPVGATTVQVPAPAAQPKVRQRISQREGQPAIVRIKRGEFTFPPAQGPQLVSRTKGGSDRYVQAQPTEIMRMVSALFTREQRIKVAEDTVTTVQGQIRDVEARLKNVPTIRDQEILSLLKTDLDWANSHLSSARKWRDFTGQKIRLYLDHALSTTPYRKTLCHDCRRTSADMADPTCRGCNGLGIITKPTDNHYALAAVEKLKHLKKVLNVTELCAKIKARTSDSDKAYAELLQNNMGLVKKFGAENQTYMEKDDAEQGAMIGIMDAAIRFNPAKPECYMCSACGEKAEIPTCDACQGGGEVGDKKCKACSGFGLKQKAGGMACPKCQNPKMMVKTSTADFKTYAYNWAYRNSRARKETDKRAGVFAPSVDAILDAHKDMGETGTLAVVAGSASSVGKLAGKRLEKDEGGLLTMDLKQQVAQLADPQQRAVINYHLAGLSLNEIAQALGISKATCSKIRDAAYGILRSKLSGYREGNVDERDTDD